MKDLLQVADQYYVLATSVLADRATRVLKQGETFAIFDRYGDINPVTHSEAGIFHMGTRYLSSLSFLIADERRPVLLNSNLRDDNGVLKVEMTNPDLTYDEIGFVPKGNLHIHREKFLLRNYCYEQVTLANYGPVDLPMPVRLQFAADYADIFEVRGMKRGKRGHLGTWSREGNELHLTYTGIDEIRRTTGIRFSGSEFDFQGDSLRFQFLVPAGESKRFQFEVCCLDSESEPVPKPRKSHAEGLASIHRNHSSGRMKYCTVRTSNDQFDAWIRRSTDDLVMMTTQTEGRFDYPYAGIPWFSAPFGRDGVITALQCLWANQGLARGVLGFLATSQARQHDADRDATPGKIIHEMRHGEMANLNEIPFGKYYGSVDSTPLFLALCGAYYRRTADRSFCQELWPSIEAGLLWLNEYGDTDGDGFLEYMSETPRGLAQQGWKDSFDSVFHADGSDAKGPIALCEVQAYAYLAKRELAPLAAALGESKLSQRLLTEAEELKRKFNESFWLKDLGTYALALDGDKRPCKVMTSNAGQCLFTGIVPAEDRAPRLVETLFSSSSFCGWGIRTVDSTQARYNPMSYHNGSIWPHDNALIAWGLNKYGYSEEAERIFDGLFRASTYMDLLRMPEVFCGFARHEGEAPTLYHHACAPQAWAAGAVYLCLQASLGLTIDAVNRKVCFKRPRLPAFLESVRISRLAVGSGTVELRIENYGIDVGVQIIDRDEDITIVVEK